MDKPPKVTIIIPTYRQARMVVRATESALAQDYLPLEVIVCDDSRDNETKDALKHLLCNDSRSKYIKNDVRLGRVGNYRYALYHQASGEWVLMLDGDDYLIDNTFISDAICGATKDKQILFVQGGGEIRRDVEADGSMLLTTRIPNIDKSERNSVVLGKDYVKQFPRKRHFLHLASLYHKESAKEIDFYRKNLLSSDLESFMRLALHGKVLLLKRAVGVWWQHSENAGKSASMNEIIDNSCWSDSVAQYAVEHRLLSQKEANKWAKQIHNLEAVGVFVREVNRCKAISKRRINIVMFSCHFVKRFPKLLLNPVFLKKMLEALVLPRAQSRPNAK